MDTLEYIKKVNKFENESRKSVKKIVVGHDAKGDEMRVLTTNEIAMERGYNMGVMLLVMKHQEAGHEIRSDFAGNLFYFDGVSTKPLCIKIEELKNEHDEFKKRLPPITPEFMLCGEQCDFEVPKLSRRKIKNIKTRDEVEK